MNYSELKKIAKTKKILLKEIADRMNVSAEGLKYSIENNTLPINKLIELCNIIGISPADFLSDNTATIQANNSGIGNTQILGSTISSTGYCASCAEKDKEIKDLQNKIILLQEKLLKL